MKPLEQVIRYWLKQKKGRKEYPKNEREALILHDSITSNMSCWECPNRLQCEWAIRHLENNLMVKEKIRQESEALKNKMISQEIEGKKPHRSRIFEILRKL